MQRTSKHKGRGENREDTKVIFEQFLKNKIKITAGGLGFQSVGVPFPVVRKK